MDWMQVFFLTFVNVGLFLAAASLIVWFRSESRADWRHMDAKTDAIHQEIKDFHQEIKDFHGRLCAIEERRLAMGK